MPRILVKAAPGLAVSRVSFGATAVELEVTRLFKSIERSRAFGAPPATSGTS